MKKIFLKCISPSVITALAMTGTTVQSAEQLEEIVVVGIKASVKQALEIKRENTNFVDAISSEDVGKLPDRNIAEALQRIPGVTIQRERGEGDFVSIRGLGPDFVRGTVNGRTLVSGTESFNSTLNGGAVNTTGRATNFDVLPSEVISTLEVYKSASAEQVEGGIGGVVNIKTARPLDIDNTVAGTLRGQYGEFSEETVPAFSGLYSWSNDDDFGILGSISYSERNIREDLGNSFGFANGTIFGGAFNTTIDNNGDGLGDTDPDLIFAPFSANPEIFLEERERLTLNTTLQWKLGENTEVIADVLWSNREVNSTQYGAIYSLAPGSQVGVQFCNVSANADGSFTCPDAVISENTLVSYPLISNIESFTDVRTGEDESINLGLNIIHNVGDWVLSGDLSYADAEGDIAFGRSVISFADGVTGTSTNPRTISGTASTLGGAVSFTPATVDPLLTIPDNYVIQQNELRNRRNTDEELALKFDAAYHTEGSAISALKLGLHWRSREKQFVEFTGNNGGRNNPVVASTISDSTLRAPGGFLDGSFRGLTPSDILFPNHAAVLAARGSDIVLAENTLGGFRAEEDTLAGYIQLDIDSNLGDMALTGNAGVRIVQTDVNVVGQSQQLTLEAQGSINVPVLSGPVQDFPFDSSYTNFLPSLNLKLDINDELLARFSYSKTLTRPEFELLAPSLNIVNATQSIASFGNPNLEPYLADNVDLSLEWYFGDASALTASLFYKEIDDFIVSASNANVTIAGVTFNSVSQPDNQGGADISGLEIGYTQAFTSLPEPFDGLGVIVNVTSVDGNLELNSGQEVAFPGISDLSINSAVYYDKGRVQARLAYSWRDEFLFDPSDVFVNSQLWADDYGQWDFSFNYEFSDNFTGFFEAINLTDEQEEQFATSETSPARNRPLSLGQVGRRLNLGVSFKF